MSTWNREESDFIQRNIHLRPIQIARLFSEEFPGSSRSYDSIQKRVQRIQQIVELEFETDDLVQERVSTETKHNSIERTRNWLNDIIEYTKQSPVVPSFGPIESDNSSLVIQLSDLHFGKSTQYFDLDIASERLLSMVNEIYERIQNIQIDEIIVVLIGDLVEGEDIFASQATKLTCSVIEQTEACTKSLWKMLTALEKLFEVPIRVEHVPGNHGRMSKTASEVTNWDNVICNNLYLLSSLTDNKIHIKKNYKKFNTFKVKDKIGGMCHEGVRHTGTPATQIKIAGWIVGKSLDFLLHGHYHEWSIGGWLGNLVLANGSLCGPDDLAERMGNEGIARQGYFLVTPGKPLWGFGFIEWPHINTNELFTRKEKRK